MDMFSFVFFCVLQMLVVLRAYGNPTAADEVILYLWFFAFAAEQFARVVGCNSAATVILTRRSSIVAAGLTGFASLALIDMHAPLTRCSNWNKFNLIVFLLFVINMPLRFTAPEYFQSQSASKAVMGVLSIFLFFRITYFYAAFEYLGPKARDLLQHMSLTQAGHYDWPHAARAARLLCICRAGYHWVWRCHPGRAVAAATA